MSGLEPLDIAGPSTLKELLTTCNDPIEAITTFQMQNSIHCPSLAPALKLLDLHNVRRLEYHETVSAELRERLLSKIRETASASSTTPSTGSKKNVATKKLEELMVKSFPLVNVDHLRPIVLETLKHMTKIPADYLKQIMNDTNLYNDVAVEVKQQIWEQKEDLFLKEIRPVIDEYLMEKRKYFIDLETCVPTYYMESSKLRRQNKQILKLTQMVGRNVTLYDRFLQFLREIYLDTKSSHLCSLRSELLMALHDADVQELINLDPCHKFAWCLDACLREKHLDPKHAAELKSVLDGIKRGKEQILGDLAMIAGDPHTLHFLCQLISKVLSHCLANESLPRDHSALQLVLRLLSVGLNAWNMHSLGEYKEPKIDSIIYTKFLSSLMVQMCEDACRLTAEKVSLDDEFNEASQHEWGELCKNWEKSVNENLLIFFKSDPLCCFLMLYYVLDLAKKKDIGGLIKILPYLSRSFGDMAYHETFLHVLLWHLCTQAEALGVKDEFFDAVFGQFLMKKMQDADEKVKSQTIKLAYFCSAKLPKLKRDYILECFQPLDMVDADDDDERSEWYRNIFVQLQKKFNDADQEKDTEASSVAATTASVSNMMQRSLSFDFPDVPTPMMMNM